MTLKCEIISQPSKQFYKIGTTRIELDINNLQHGDVNHLATGLFTGISDIIVLLVIPKSICDMKMTNHFQPNKQFYKIGRNMIEPDINNLQHGDLKHSATGLITLVSDIIVQLLLPKSRHGIKMGNHFSAKQVTPEHGYT